MKLLHLNASDLNGDYAWEDTPLAVDMLDTFNWLIEEFDLAVWMDLRFDDR